MQLELYFYNECGFSRRVLNTINNLGVGNKIVMKNIRENADYEKELIGLSGDRQVPALKVDEKLLRGSEEINQFLVGQFLD
ncbi:MAG: glutaredoxin family protein [Candidatus Binatia bacterium]